MKPAPEIPLHDVAESMGAMLYGTFHAFGYVFRPLLDAVCDIFYRIGDAMPDTFEETFKAHRKVLFFVGVNRCLPGPATDQTAAIKH
ncbi:hypothetical protein [Xanthomonas translucens]|uniref:Uncharacterized protein n=1 Tax=Xanthomonas translucens pv. translucens TaxID=134875 RepID=A0ABW9KZF3_XANCT|nr:hypothetical protein [Xanthomonas translucens]MCC8447590.1 hypothetical protein [Xanthomonas translucens pv. translucens]MCS3360725.1 hypothetical protein [Xanthomonas translucens pv. translucens]MCS3373920.1 hypothetical protein [Xanthomonas translucens pv. translucens]MCT8274647.1 hypothetical protein [Xanthomonas translucens pv. translucens]MCT8278566.1 hypothetical protein [Xanthomonas translucens pv. translucens]